VSSYGSDKDRQPIAAAKSERMIRFGGDGLDLPVLVEVELSGSSFRAEYRQLGSLTERRGMRLYFDRLVSPSPDRARVSVAVPRARTQAEAEAAVASLLEYIRPRNTHGRVSTSVETASVAR
jgi:hypothetical protein